MRAVLLGRRRSSSSKRARAFGVFRPRRSRPARSASFSSGRSPAQTRARTATGSCDVINIRDWHIPDDNYDYERRRQAPTASGHVGVRAIDGLEGWLTQPAAAASGG